MDVKRLAGVPVPVASGRVRTLMTYLAAVLSIAAAVGAVAYFLPPRGALLIGVSAAAPYLLALSAPALVAFLFSRHLLLGVIPAVLVVVALVLYVPSFVAADVPAGHRDFVVMTANLKIGGADADAVVAEVKKRHVDALMLEELTPEAQTRLTSAGLSAVLPHRVSEPGGAASGTGLWSRYPLTRVSTPNLSFNLVAARVTVPGSDRRPTLLAVHVGGPVPDSTNWRHDFERLPGVLRDLPDDASTVVGGDFNATTSVAQFRGLLTGGYADAGNQAGGGLLRTFPADRWFPPLIGIDHVLTRDAVGRSAETVTIPGSDHRALVVTVALAAT